MQDFSSGQLGLAESTLCSMVTLSEGTSCTHTGWGEDKPVPTVSSSSSALADCVGAPFEALSPTKHATLYDYYRYC